MKFHNMVISRIVNLDYKMLALLNPSLMAKMLKLSIDLKLMHTWTFLVPKVHMEEDMISLELVGSCKSESSAGNQLHLVPWVQKNAIG